MNGNRHIEMEMLIRGNFFKSYLEEKYSMIKKQYKLNKIEIEILYYLGINTEENTLVDICRKLYANKGQVSHALLCMGARGYVNAIQDEHDKRYWHYELTEQAKKVSAEISEIWVKTGHEVFEGIAPEDLETFRKISIKMRENIKKNKKGKKEEKNA